MGGVSVTDIDAAGHRRMKDYMKPEDMDTGGCLELASAILRQQAEELTVAVQRAAKFPSNGNLQHVRDIKKFYKGDMFKILSCGLIDGEVALREIVRAALKGG